MDQKILLVNFYLILCVDQKILRIDQKILLVNLYLILCMDQKILLVNFYLILCMDQKILRMDKNFYLILRVDKNSPNFLLAILLVNFFIRILLPE